MLIRFLGWRGPNLALQVASHDVLSGEVPERKGERVSGELDGEAFTGRVADVRHFAPGEPSIVLVAPSGETAAGTVQLEWADPADEIESRTLSGRILTTGSGDRLALQIDRPRGLTADDVAAGVRAMASGDKNTHASILSWHVTNGAMIAEVGGLAEFLSTGTMERA